MICSPSDEGPVGAMPEAAHKENDEGVSDDLCFRYTASAQWDVDIISEPCRERDVPPAPELSNVPAEIRHVEVAHQFDTEQLRRSDGNV